MKIIGIGHIDKINKPKTKTKKQMDIILLPGIGDIIYSWYKLIHYVNMGYEFNVKVLNCYPQRSHQIMGCLQGMNSFEYIDGFDYSSYWLKNINDLTSPPNSSLFRNIPVLHINSFLESGIELKEFMPSIPISYDIEILTKEEAKRWSKENIDQNYF